MKPEHIILAAHGAGQGSPANELVESLAARVGAKLGIDTTTSYNLGEPHFSEALKPFRGQRVTLVPLMTAEAYFTAGLVPKLLSEGAEGVDWTWAPALGATSAFTEFITRAVSQHLQTSPDETSLLIVGHGTRRDKRSGRTADTLAAAIAGAIPGLDVRTAFIDQDPEVEPVIEGITRANLLVLPFLLGGGGHALDDVPRRVGAAMNDRPWNSMPPFGEIDGIVDLIAHLATTAAERSPLRLGTRGSKLALVQVDMTERALAAVGVPSSRVVTDTIGDRDLSTPMQAFGSDGIFTDELDAALTRGDIDVAIHSAKDLPIEESGFFEVALRRGDVRDALVTRDGLTLEQLPHGASVGTCSTRRSAQLLAMRPDLNIQPIRGPVDRRVGLVEQGEFDAAVLAFAGLDRLGLADAASEVFDADALVPDPAQAAIILRARPDDEVAKVWLSRINDERTLRAVRIERVIAREAAAQGRVAAVHAHADDSHWHITARLADEHGADAVVTTSHEDADHAIAAIRSQLLQTRGTTG